MGRARDEIGDQLIAVRREIEQQVERAGRAKSQIVALLQVGEEEALLALDLDALWAATNELTAAKSAVRVLAQRRRNLTAQMS